MVKTILVLLIVALAAAAPAFADGVSYTVTVDTSSVNGTSGSLDFQFNPGFTATQAVDLQILDFTTDGTLGSSTLTGDVSGALPGTLTFDNGTSYNDYFTGFTYGNTLQFVVNLYGPAIDSPDGVSTSGSTFAFSMFSDPNGYYPILTNDNVTGAAVITSINLDGSVTPQNSSTQTTVTEVGGPVPTPEPGTLLLLVSALSATMLVTRLYHGRSTDRRDVWVGLKPTERL